MLREVPKSSSLVKESRLSYCIVPFGKPVLCVVSVCCFGNPHIIYTAPSINYFVLRKTYNFIILKSRIKNLRHFKNTGGFS